MSKKSKKKKIKNIVIDSDIERDGLVIVSEQLKKETNELFKKGAKDLGNQFVDKNGQWILVHPKASMVFRTEPEIEMLWLDEDGFPMKTADEIRDFNKRMNKLDKEQFLAKKKGRKSKRKKKNLPDAQFKIDNWDELLITIRDGSEWVTFTKMYDGKPAINEKFELSYKQLGFKEPSAEFLRICATSNNTGSFPFGDRKVKSRVDNIFRQLFMMGDSMSIIAHPKKSGNYIPVFKIWHYDRDGNSRYGHAHSNEYRQLPDEY